MQNKPRLREVMHVFFFKDYMVVNDLERKIRCYLLASYFSIGPRFLSIAMDEHCFQNGPGWKLFKSTLDASLSQHWFKMISPVDILSPNYPRLCRVGFSLSVFNIFFAGSVSRSLSSYICLNFVPRRLVSE